MLHVWYQNKWLVGGLEMFGTFSHIYWDGIIPTDKYFSEGFKPPTRLSKYTHI
jgi:hypothetical protein